MIEIINAKNPFPKFDTIDAGTIFSWPISLPKSERAYAIKTGKGMLWIHDTAMSSNFCCDKGFFGRNLSVEIEGQILIKRGNDD